MVFGKYADWLGDDDLYAYKQRAHELEKEVDRLKSEVTRLENENRNLRLESRPLTETEREWS